jgi:hypothetical protein
MMVVLLVAGIGFLLAGLLAIVFGIPVKEFSFGNTLILTGAILACTGAMLLGLWAAVRELKNIALQPGVPRQSPAASASAALSATLGNQAPEVGGFLFSGDQPAPENAGHAEPTVPSPPWHGEVASRDRVRNDAPVPPEPVEAAAKPKRNLLFASSSRKERERAQARPVDSPAADSHPPSAATAPVAESGEPPPATFDDAWPKPERARAADTPSPPPLRSGRAPSTFTEPAAGAAGTVRSPPAVRTQDQPQVTVLKSGVVDGMAYSLYSDGSIEAQMPEGMMRFASIDELRAHLDHRP